MEQYGAHISRNGLYMHGLEGARAAYWNTSAPTLCEQAVRRGEALFSADGALVRWAG